MIQNLAKIKEGNVLEKFKASIENEVNRPLRDITNSAGLSQEQVEFRKKLLKEYNFGYKY